ncbi:FMN-binding negative transcriptional regulator [Oceanobacillus neutriphilus]|uniref:Protease synthase and sporulation protein PAI 2 n=1 Tax=Oceanobacillus neutriphilus TaxID=531815 RepID=A0ABQ2P128_9BACI|nr:FMN-binding negative transcriptional regulator [Oceanobacillus neutriphilus]GGP15581.1 protease synthase and sporulation protein PAI 2 [Oceanobacillus neutriphilus]
MYIPKRFKVTDTKEIWEFVNQHSFATLVTTENSIPVATHLPVTISKKDDDYIITGHVAYANPQWKTFENAENVLVIFQGPHAYISPTWYTHENVPTWNYQAVHMYGAPRMLDKDELRDTLAILSDKYEKHRDPAFSVGNFTPELLEAQLKAIVGFEVRVTEIQAVYKLSQNRKEADYKSVMNHLQREGDSDSHKVAEQMEKNRHLP